MANHQKMNSIYSIILIVLFIGILIAIYYLFWHDDNNYQIVLNGNKEVTLILGTNYVEPGYQVFDSKKNDVTNKVEVISNVNINKEGEYKIEYRLNGRILSTRKVKVVTNTSPIDDQIPVTNIFLDKEKVVIGVGKSLTINPSINPLNATNKEITWTSSNPDIVIVNDGLIMGKKDGIATITATTSNGLTATCEVIVDNTPPTINKCTARVSSDAINYIIDANDISGISKYVHNNQDYQNNIISVSKSNEDNVIKVYDNFNNYSEIVCQYEPIKEKNGANIVSRYDSNTLKYWIERPATYYTISHIWTSDAYHQLKIAENQTIGTLETAKTILDREINKNNYYNKGMIAINASGFIVSTKTSDSYWNYHGWSTAKFSSRAPLIIANGVIVRDFTNYELPSSLYPLYAVKKNGYLTSYTFYSGSSSINQNKKVVNTIKNDGVNNTFSFYPKLIENYQNLVQNEIDSSYIEPNVRQAVCQIDANNFVIISNIVSQEDSNAMTQIDRDNGLSYKSMAALLINQGCKTAYNLDGGGSVSFYYKGNTSTIKSLNKSSRLVADILYFVEK